MFKTPLSRTGPRTDRPSLLSLSSVQRLIGPALLVACTALTGQQALAEVAAIHLNDGTTVRGEVIGLKGGSYQIKSNSLGELNIPQSKIKLVEFNPSTAAAAPAAPAANPANPGAQATLSNITSRLQSSPALLGDIHSLTNDPDIMAIVQDPEIQRLIAAGDYTALMGNAKMRRLMSNSKIRNITNQLK